MDIPKNPYYGKNPTFLGLLRSLFVNQSKRERDYEHNLRLRDIRDRAVLNRALTKSIYQRRMEEMGFAPKSSKGE